MAAEKNVQISSVFLLFSILFTSHYALQIPLHTRAQDAPPTPLSILLVVVQLCFWKERGEGGRGEGGRGGGAHTKSPPSPSSWSSSSSPGGGSPDPAIPCLASCHQTRQRREGRRQHQLDPARRRLKRRSGPTPSPFTEARSAGSLCRGGQKRKSQEDDFADETTPGDGGRKLRSANP